MAGRPSNRDDRYEQVMQALIHCVARYGVEGASLAQIAEEAGLKRPLVRHHLGNREDMIAALQDYVFRGFTEQTESMIAAAPPAHGSKWLVDILFSEAGTSSPEYVLVFAALTARAAEDADLQAECRSVVLDFEDAVSTILRSDFPGADNDQLQATAHGIVAVYFNATSLASLSMSVGWQARAKTTAQMLLNTLKDMK